MKSSSSGAIGTGVDCGGGVSLADRSYEDADEAENAQAFIDSDMPLKGDVASANDRDGLI